MLTDTLALLSALLLSTCGEHAVVGAQLGRADAERLAELRAGSRSGEVEEAAVMTIDFAGLGDGATPHSATITVWRELGAWCVECVAMRHGAEGYAEDRHVERPNVAELQAIFERAAMAFPGLSSGTRRA
jgi:hypothetical protein